MQPRWGWDYGGCHNPGRRFACPGLRNTAPSGQRSHHPGRIPPPRTDATTQGGCHNPGRIPPPRTDATTQGGSHHPGRMPQPRTDATTQDGCHHPGRMPQPRTALRLSWASKYSPFGAKNLLIEGIAFLSGAAAESRLFALAGGQGQVAKASVSWTGSRAWSSGLL